MKRIFSFYSLFLVTTLALSSHGFAGKKRKKPNNEIEKLIKEEQRTRLRNDLIKEKIREVDLQLRLIKRNRTLEKQVNRPQPYTENPFNPLKNILTVSDRQIMLDEPVTRPSADKVVKEINFYNNKSKKPIFLMIRSPGGSIMAGYQILNAIKHSEAPVYVVVKEFAASMAAIILALSERSFAMPDARILHHEPSTFFRGNTSAMMEELEVMKEFERRLVGPLLEKFGYSSIEEWRADIYKHTKSGDWEEFGDRAHKLGWVNNLVVNIKDTSVRSLAPIETGAKGVLKLTQQPEEESE